MAEPSQHVEVGDHGDRRVEGSDEVLPLGRVDAGLAAHGRIDHRGDGGGDLEHVDAAQPGGRDEAGEIRRRAAAEPDHEVLAADLGLAAHAPQEPGDLRGLGLLAVGDLGGEGLPPRLLDAGPDLLGDVAQARLVHDHHSPGALGHQGGDLLEQAPSHVHVVAAGGRGDGDDGGAHSVSSWGRAGL